MNIGKMIEFGVLGFGIHIYIYIYTCIQICIGTRYLCGKYRGICTPLLPLQHSPCLSTNLFLAPSLVGLFPSWSLGGVWGGRSPSTILSLLRASTRMNNAQHELYCCLSYGNGEV